MSVPAPSILEWTGLLVLLGVLVAGAGEGVRALLARRVAFFRAEEPFERFLVDLYLGGALLYLLASVPLGLFRPPVEAAFLLLGWAVAAWTGLRGSRLAELVPRLGRFLAPLRRPFVLVALAASLALGALELSVAGTVPSGNTFDASVDTMFVALLQLHGSLTYTLDPISTGLVAYPQGSTVWLAIAQQFGTLPPSQTALLVSPFFMGLAPLAGYVVGRRWMGTESAGAAFALVLGVMGPGTRYLASGSYDFVLAFPLVLYLVSRTREWIGPVAPSLRDAFGFGALTGVSAALNPVGAEWLFLLLPLMAFLPLAPRPASALRWVGAWGTAAAVAVLWVVPSLRALTGGAASSPPGGSVGLPVGGFVALTDPFVIRSNVITFSPFPGLSVELAVLLGIGAVVLLWPALRGSAAMTEFGRWALAGILSGLAWLGAGVLAGPGRGVLGWLPPLTSFGELSVLLFTVYTLVAAVPIAILLRRVEREDPPVRSPKHGDGSPTHRPPFGRTWGDRRAVAAGLAVILIVPGIAVTTTQMPGYLETIYGSFSNVTAADFDLLAWAGGHLPSGARVLVAPGSAAEFLPGYAPKATLLFPMTGNAWRADPAYLELEHLLDAGALGANGTRDLAQLGVQFVAVTGNSSVLYPAFSPAPFLGNSAFPVLFHEADAYLFQWAAAPPG